MPATIREVAREAGVSVATVSRVMNDSGPVRDTTRERVRTAATRLRFTPDITAQSLSTRRTNTLGVLLPDVYGEFYSEVLRGIDQTAQRHGFHVLISGAHNKPSEVDAAVRAMRGRVDGLVLMASELDVGGLAMNLPGHMPVVLINADHDASHFDTINIDNYGGAVAMTNHLLSLGHRDVFMIRGPSGNRDAEERARGFLSTHRAAVCNDGTERLAAGDFTEGSGYRAAQTLLARSPRPTAIFAANDSMAVGALSALREAGVRTPEDIAVVGFDDVPIAEFVSPRLTTVRVSIATLGARAAERLFTSLLAHNSHERKHEVLVTTLVVRRSCGATMSHTVSEEVVQ